MPSVLYSLDDTEVATITFNRDEKRNAFDREMATALLLGLERAEREQSRVVILRASPGATVWCAGHDLVELDPETLDDNPMIEIFKRIQSTPLPVVARVEGTVHGGGLIILLAADIVLAAKTAEISITSNKLGLPLPAEVYEYWLRVMGIHKAKELLFTASGISAHEAKYAGLYNYVVETGQLESLTSEIVHKILQCNREGLANTKYQLNLIAQRSALTDEDRAEITASRSAILDSEQIKARISKLLKLLGDYAAAS